MSAVVDPAIVGLATEARWHVSVVAGRTVIEDGEITFVARADRDADFVLERGSRGSDLRVDVRSNSWDAVQLTLCMILGPDWRSAHKLPPLDAAGHGRAVLDVELVDAEDLHKDVRWGDGQYAIGLRRGKATTLSHLLGRRIKEVVDSYRDPDGLPVFA